jgi:Flp pilus assembly pilin Flp
MSSILRFIKEEEGAEVVEVGIWLSLIVAASIGLIVTIGGKVKTAFTTISTASF